MFQTGGQEHAVRRARNRSRRNARFCIGETREIIRSNQFRQILRLQITAFNFDAAEIERRYTLFIQTLLQIGQDNDRTLVLFREIERFRRHVETFFGGSRRDDDFAHVAVRTVNRRHDIALFHLGRHARRRAGSHDIDNDHRNFRDRRQRNRFRHQRQTRARCRGERADAGEVRADRHHAGRQLVFRLHNGAVHAVNRLNHVFHDFGRRRNRVARHETGACRESAKRDRLIAHQKQQIGIRRFGQASGRGKIFFLLIDQTRPLVERAHVGRDHFLRLFREAIRNRRDETFAREAQVRDRHAERHNIFHLQRAALFGGIRDRQSQERNARRQMIAFRREFRVGDQHAARTQFVTVLINRFLIERDQVVHAFADRSQLMAGDPQCEGRMPALDARGEQTLGKQ